MRIAHEPDGELLHPCIERLQIAGGCFERMREGCLVSLVQRSEIDCLDGFVQLLLAFLFAVRKSVDDGFGSLNLTAEETGIGLTGIIHDNFGAKKSALLLVKWNLDRDLEFLAWLGFVRDQNRVQSAAVSLSHQTAI